MSLMSKLQTRVKDRISGLPDEVLIHILSFLPTLSAVRTTILSKRWKNKWTSVPNLDFDDARDLVTYDEGCYNSALFTAFVDYVLAFRDSSDIHKFRLQISYRQDNARINRWICTAVWRNVVELDLYVPDPDFYMDNQLPENLLMCKTLKVLKVHSIGWPIHYAPPQSGFFPSLKILHVTVDDPGVLRPWETLFRYCPLLEDLTIDGDISNNEIYEFKISAPKLKALRISLDAPSRNFKIYINAPKLEQLDLQDVALSSYCLENAKFLVNASIVFRAFKAIDGPCFPEQAISLLCEFSNVKFLSLSAHFLEASHLPLFRNLKQLNLVLHNCNYWELLGVLLKKSPNLEGLVLEDKTKCNEEDSRHQWNPPKRVPNCLLSDLNTITIRGFRGRQAEIEVTKYLLKKALVLEKMTVHIGPLVTEEKELYKEFLMFQRGSNTCQVEFIRMQ